MFWSRKFSEFSKKQEKGGVLLNCCPAANRETDCPWSGARIIPVHVRRNIKLAEAPSYGKTIFEYEPKCNGAEDYKTVAEYIHSQTGAELKGQALRHCSGQAEPVVVGQNDTVEGGADVSVEQEETSGELNR